MRDINTADTFLPSNGPSRNTQRCAGFDRPRMRCAAMGSRRYDDTKRSTACRNSRASSSRCCRLRSSRPRLLPLLRLRDRFFFSFFFASAPNAGGAAPNGSGFSTAGAGAGARAVGAKGSTAGSSSGSSAFLALRAFAAFASLPPRLEPVFFFFGEALGAILPIGTSSSESLFVSVACACNCEIGTSSSSLESSAGAGAGASLSASSSFAFRLVTRVPPRRPRAIVLALRVNANSHARRATGSKIAGATSSDSLAFAGSTEARENALAAAATRPPLLCGGLLLPVLSLLLSSSASLRAAVVFQRLSSQTCRYDECPVCTQGLQSRPPATRADASGL